MQQPYLDHGPVGDMYFDQYFQSDNSHADAYGQDYLDLETMFLAQEPAPAAFPQRPTFKRNPSSSESFRHTRPDMKKSRSDSTWSSVDQQSTATSACSGESNHASPSFEIHAAAAPSPVPELASDYTTRVRRAPPIVPALPLTATGQTPSVLLPGPPSGADLQKLVDLEEARLRTDRAASLAEHVAREGRQHEQLLSHMRQVDHAAQADETSNGGQAEVEDAGRSRTKSGPKRQYRKKAAKQQAPPPPPILEDKDEGDHSLDEGGKRVQFLERNRVAACKSRQKKKDWIKSLEVQFDDLNKQNGDLQVLVTALRDEIATLRGALAAHSACTCRVGTGATSTHRGSRDFKVDSGLPKTAAAATAATFAGAPWASNPSSSKGTPGPRASGIIDFNRPTGLDADYFGQGFAAPRANPLDTPELARSLGFS